MICVAAIVLIGHRTAEQGVGDYTLETVVE